MILICGQINKAYDVPMNKEILNNLWSWIHDGHILKVFVSN